MAVIKLTKTGNSVGFRLPKSELDSLRASVGDQFDMQVTDGELRLKKVSNPRDGWFDNICPITAGLEVESMNRDFNPIIDDNLDEYEWRDEW